MAGMYSTKNFLDKWKRYGQLEGSEIRGLMITTVILAFIFSFREWGVDTFDPKMGFQNLFISIILVGIAFMVHQVAIRSVGLMIGYKVKYRMWLLGLVIGLVMIFVSNGYLPFLATGGLMMSALEIHQLGRWRAGVNYKHLGWIAMTGPIALMFVSVLLKTLHVITEVGLFEKAMNIFILIALFDMIPIPPYNGSKTFFGSRFIYVFMLGALIGTAALLKFMGGILPIIGGIVLGALVLLVWFVHVDKRW